MNGNMVLEHEEKHSERLQEEFTEKHGKIGDWQDNEEYWEFVLEDMNG